MLIASRILKLRSEDNDTDVAAHVYAPEREEETGAWGCRYEVDWPDKRSVKTIFGFDSVQALVLALQTIGAEIYSSNYHEAGQLFLDKPGTGYGFPVVPTYRDLLQGDDAKYL